MGHYFLDTPYIYQIKKNIIIIFTYIQVEESIESEDRLGISSYGVSMTTLEEVFLHLGEQEEVADESSEPSTASRGGKNGLVSFGPSCYISKSIESRALSFQAQTMGFMEDVKTVLYSLCVKNTTYYLSITISNFQQAIHI